MSLPELQEVPLKKTSKKEKDHPSMTAKMKYQRDKDREMVRGKFIYHEVPGGSMSFSILLYPGDESVRYDFIDGEVYTVPLGVAKHLNKNLWYPVHEYALDENGKQIMKIGNKVRRCSFQSLEFVDIDDISPVGNIVTVENV